MARLRQDKLRKPSQRHTMRAVIALLSVLLIMPQARGSDCSVAGATFHLEPNHRSGVRIRTLLEGFVGYTYIRCVGDALTF